MLRQCYSIFGRKVAERVYSREAQTLPNLCCTPCYVESQLKAQLMHQQPVIRAILSGLLLCGCLCVSAQADERKNLQGTWEAVSARLNGKEFPLEKGKGIRVIVTSKTMKFTVNGKVHTPVSTYELNMAPDPRQINLSTQVKGKPAVSQGIYELSRDKLRLCYTQPGAERPAEFKTVAEDNRFLIVFKRK